MHSSMSMCTLFLEAYSASMVLNFHSLIWFFWGRSSTQKSKLEILMICIWFFSFSLEFPCTFMNEFHFLSHGSFTLPILYLSGMHSAFFVDSILVFSIVIFIILEGYMTLVDVEQHTIYIYMTLFPCPRIS